MCVCVCTHTRKKSRKIRTTTTTAAADKAGIAEISWIICFQREATETHSGNTVQHSFESNYWAPIKLWEHRGIDTRQLLTRLRPVQPNIQTQSGEIVFFGALQKSLVHFDDTRKKAKNATMCIKWFRRAHSATASRHSVRMRIGIICDTRTASRFHKGKPSIRSSFVPFATERGGSCVYECGAQQRPFTTAA